MEMFTLSFKWLICFKKNDGMYNINRHTFFHTCSAHFSHCKWTRRNWKDMNVYSFNLNYCLIHLIHLRLFTECFGIHIVNLNITFSHFSMFTHEISQIVWSWKFGLKSWTPIGRHVCDPWSHVYSKSDLKMFTLLLLLFSLLPVQPTTSCPSWCPRCSSGCWRSPWCCCGSWGGGGERGAPMPGSARRRRIRRL